ncbi:MAG: 16S rRNA processing protein RimM [Rikenellaceae bacterium]|nr:16S rRNA processing protein RimM [Rikenellaceae bacterium]
MEKQAVARVGKLFGEADKGGLSITLYNTFPDDFNPDEEPLMVEIDSLAVPLWCDSFERRGVSGANVRFADFDSTRRAEELIGKELYMLIDEEGDDDEFYMEDLIGFAVRAGRLKGEIVDYYDSEHNPLFGVDFGEGERLIPAAEEFIAGIDFDKRTIKMILPDGLLEL